MKWLHISQDFITRELKPWRQAQVHVHVQGLVHLKLTSKGLCCSAGLWRPRINNLILCMNIQPARTSLGKFVKRWWRHKRSTVKQAKIRFNFNRAKFESKESIDTFVKRLKNRRNWRHSLLSLAGTVIYVYRTEYHQHLKFTTGLSRIYLVESQTWTRPWTIL